MGCSLPYTRHYKSRLVFFFNSILTSAAAYITDNLCTKNGNSSFFQPKIRGLYTRAVTDQERVIVVQRVIVAQRVIVERVGYLTKYSGVKNSLDKFIFTT